MNNDLFTVKKSKFYWNVSGHGRFGVGLGTSLRLGGGGLNRGEVRPSGDSYGASTNYPGSGFDHSGSGVHVSGNKSITRQIQDNPTIRKNVKWYFKIKR